MTKDKKFLYTISIAAFAALLTIFILTARNSNILTAAAMALITPLVCLLIRKRATVSINKKEALLLTTVVAVLYVILILIAGTFSTSYINPYFVTSESLLRTVIPAAVIIITSEIIRFVFLSQKNTFATVLSWFICVLAEIMIFSGASEIDNVNLFMDLVGLTLFPAICANIYYHYSSKSFGALPNICFRLIFTLYVYFVPKYTEIPDALHACIKILLPLGVLTLTKALFDKQKKNVSAAKGDKISLVGMLASGVVIVSIAMLISCQFRFGAIVIATGSMTGEINKGDVIIYERYDDQTIKSGQVIVFLDDESKIVHRVVRIENISGEIRYYTKGDANTDEDQGYRTEADIVGLTDLKIAYVGYPTLWLHELINSVN